MADNLTHGLAGALLAQTGLQQRYGPAATIALVVGAELPGLDVLFALGGPVLSFMYHRGMTHSLLGGTGLALLAIRMVRQQRHRQYGLGSLVGIGVGGALWSSASWLATRPWWLVACGTSLLGAVLTMRVARRQPGA
jgi:membrane-bound metal-dependent hydrolase YbcI (DUF457 family)